MSDRPCWTHPADHRNGLRHAGQPRLRSARPRVWPLTSRETEVLAAMAAGKTNAAIAEFLFISRKAVEKHVNSIFSKLLLSARDEQHPRVAAVLLYLDHVQTAGRKLEAPPRRATGHHGGRHSLAGRRLGTAATQPRLAAVPA